MMGRGLSIMLAVRRQVVVLLAAILALPLCGQSSRFFTPSMKVFMAVDSMVVDSLVLDIDTLIAMASREELLPQVEEETGLSFLSFSVIYKPRGYDMSYSPTNIQEKKLKEYQSMMLGRTSEGLLPKVGDPIEEARYRYLAEHPERVEYTWREIPEPWKDIRDGKKLTKDKKEELSRLAKMFAVENKDTNEKVRQTVKVVSPWSTTGEENLQMSQLYLHNWIKGGESSLSLTSDFRFKARYSNQRHQWDSDITHKLGFTKTSTLGTRLSNDAFELNSKYGYRAVNKWYYSFLTTFKTQLFRNYASNDKEKKTPKSTILSPAYLQFIVGMDYKRDNLSLLLSPFTSIITLVADTSLIDQTKYSIKPNRKSNVINGFSITWNWKKPIMTGVAYTTKGELFYEYFEKDGQKRLDWENIFDMQINRYLATRLIFELRYYENESTKFQIKENINIAFKYVF